MVIRNSYAQWVPMMNQSNKIKVFFLLAGLVAAGSPVLAKNGADDPVGHGSGGTDDPPGDDRGGGQHFEPGDDRGHGVGLEPGDDHGVHGIQVSGGNLVVGVQRRKLGDDPGDPSKVQGNLTHIVRKKGQSESFDLQLKVRFRSGDPSLGMNTLKAAQNAAVFALFRDDTGAAKAECRFEFDEKAGQSLEYRVKLLRNGSKLREKEGACDTDLSNGTANPGIPVPSNGRVEIYVDTPAGRKTIGGIRY